MFVIHGMLRSLERLQSCDILEVFSEVFIICFSISTERTRTCDLISDIVLGLCATRAHHSHVAYYTRRPSCRPQRAVLIEFVA